MKKTLDTYTKESIIQVVECVCDALQINKEDVFKKTRQGMIVLARQMSMYILRRNTKYKLDQIGGFFDRDHSTVEFAVNKIDDLLDSRDQLTTHCYNVCIKKLSTTLKGIENQRIQLSGLNFIIHSASTFR